MYPSVELVPLATAEMIPQFAAAFNCASGTRLILWRCNPASELAGYYRRSLRDLRYLGYLRRLR
jgi:hypothetical protein